MNAAQVKETKRLALEFVALCDEWQVAETKRRAAERRATEQREAQRSPANPHPYIFVDYYIPARLAPAVKRRSMDLTHALADLRKPS